MAGARDVAYRVLTRVEQEGAFAAAALQAESRSLKDSRDMGLAGELVLGTLRRQSWLDRLLATAVHSKQKKTDPRLRRIMRLALYQLAFLSRVPSHAAISEAVNQTERIVGKHATGFVNAVLRRLAKSSADQLAPPPVDASTPSVDAAVSLSVPLWMYERFVSQFGVDATVGLLEAFNQRSRRTLRVDPTRVDPAEVAGADPKAFELGALSPLALHAASRGAAQPFIEDGTAVWQDEGSQLVALALDVQPGQEILDACAGRGGKTGTLAVLTGGKGRITAVDRSASKLERLGFELDKQGYSAQTAAVDLSDAAAFSNRQFDRILLDAPCSGSGTIGRRPEIRWRLAPEAIGSLQDVQRKMLDVVAPLVRPAGRLVYAVCSVFDEESDAHVESFLKAHPDFELAGIPVDGWPASVPWNGGRVFVDPLIGGTDGYRILVFQRR